MFKDRDVICFLGDSITAGGIWMAEVYQILRKKHKIKCYNCGVSGGIARKAFHYLQSECLVFNPDYVSIMFGINDIDFALYKKENENLPDIQQKKKEAIDICITHYRGILEQVEAAGAKPIICIPVPYDDVSENETPVASCREGLEILESHLRSLAKEFDCKVVDFKTTFSKFLGKDDVMSEDRVHPTPKGHHIMAQTYLYEIGEIDKCDFETPFEFEEWNEKRFEKEQQLLMTNFIEYCVLFDEGWLKDASFEEKKKMAKKRYDEKEDKEAFTVYLKYIENIDIRTKIRGEVVALTKF